MFAKLRFELSAEIGCAVIEKLRADTARERIGKIDIATDERVQLQAERELLSLMAAGIDDFRGQADRIAQISWADERHEAMAWAMLATPEGTPAAQVVQAATAVVEDAPRILSSGQVVASAGSKEQRMAFVLDTVELYSTRRLIRDIRARLRAGEDGAGGLFAQATKLQQRVNDLSHNLSVYSIG